ncbi:GGDEF domain-containing protein [Chitiniphilus purpureus]|uniref:GGDEF domain-containing protein n=1 Tax=Chitiniphilus purpureus TaxID=2981137 RepID=A0ABY6DMB2_9NEIS|nr:GGDEF domain-containing protein [Chitiniphilus sp. CD1]UXY15494.1 GGDEF domain-containing protein [Chitiniphilus sp. CD1]
METLQQENSRLRHDLAKMAVLLQTAQHDANHDPLTGLANRLLMLDRLANALALAARQERQVGVLMIDLDGFKLVNDDLGHDIGDQVLKLVADRLNYCVRASDTVARIGGDEFAVILPDIGGAAVLIVMDHINRALAQPYLLETSEIHLSASIGKSMAQGDQNMLPQELLADADQDMYRIKRQQRHSLNISTMWNDIAAIGLYAPRT